MNKGFVFSLDLAIAAIALLMMAFLMLSHMSLEKEMQLQESGKISLQRKAIFLIDAMVKNRSEGNPAAGSAALDLQKKRAGQNELDLGLLSKAGQLQGGEFSVAGIFLDFGKGRETVFLGKQAGECIGLDRLVSVQGKLARVEVVVCEKEQQ